MTLNIIALYLFFSQITNLQKHTVFCKALLSKTIICVHSAVKCLALYCPSSCFVLCPQPIYVHRQPEDSRRNSSGHEPVGYHNNDYEDCPQVLAVMAWMDGRTSWLLVLVESHLDGEIMCSIVPVTEEELIGRMS